MIADLGRLDRAVYGVIAETPTPNLDVPPSEASSLADRRRPNRRGFDTPSPHGFPCITQRTNGGHQQLPFPKLITRVRFPSSDPFPVVVLGEVLTSDRISLLRDLGDRNDRDAVDTRNHVAW